MQISLQRMKEIVANPEADAVKHNFGKVFKNEP